MSAPSVRRLSAEGRGAIAVVAVRGAGALERVAALAGGARLATGDLRLVELRRGDAPLDRALVAVAAEDDVELHLHGSPALVGEVLDALGGETPESAAGSLEERARRALATAPCEAGARILLDQAEGALRRELESARALEDDALGRRLDELLERARVARHVLQPARVLLRGPVNAGKSTLFNALVASERVLVADEPGTTRDVVRERAWLAGYPIELWDTPGERGADAAPSRALELERAGLGLALDLEVAADWIVWLAPPGAPTVETGDGRRALFSSRADERADEAPHPLAAGPDPAGAAQAVAARFRAHFRLPERPWTPGAGVPFEPALVEALRAARTRTGAERRTLLCDLLGPRVDPRPARG